MKTNNAKKWSFFIDCGGTFTDIVAINPEGHVVTHKLLSENKKHYKNSALQGIRDLLNISATEAIPTDHIEEVRIGTTLVTNCLLEHKGAPVVFVVTQGYEDSLSIGYQARPDIFALDIKKPQQLYQKVIGVHERISSDGQIHQTPDKKTVQLELQRCFDAGFRAIAITFMHGYCYPQNEEIVAQLAKNIGFTQISTSATSPLIKFISRAQTTVANAYLTPVLETYIQDVSQALSGVRLHFMQSNGGLVAASFMKGIDAVLSGPAGGIVGCVQPSLEAGFDKIVGFDMGGTSTDVSHFNGHYEREFEEEIAGISLSIPMLRIHTVAAGGGSVCQFKNGSYQVGPESAGAYPGPACYRNGGPLTVTDCNVMLGRINSKHFPSIFGPNADQPLDTTIVKDKFTQLAEFISQETGTPHSAESVADGFLRVAVENMANAIKKITTHRGYDVRDYVLCSFGGAGNQHACAIADSLEMKQLLIHPYASLLSAYGIGLAEMRVIKSHSFQRPFTESNMNSIEKECESLKSLAENELSQQTTQPITSRISCMLRYKGSDTHIETVLAPYAKMVKDFENQHQQAYGFISHDQKLVIDAISAEAISEPAHTNQSIFLRTTREKTIHRGQHEKIAVYLNEQWQNIPLYHRDKLNREDTIKGPAMIIEKNTTCLLEAGWSATLDKHHNLIFEHHTATQKLKTNIAIVDPVMLEIFNNAFMSIAEEMGAVLQKTAFSVNIKERLDFSCALFDSQGNLIANAPHVPVHLGSMGDAVKSIRNQFHDNMCEHDAFFINSPYHGGTHLPDITVVAPIFVPGTEEILGFAASRAHHSDIGGITPGSIPANSQTIEQEGVIIWGLKLLENGQFLEVDVKKALLSGPYPARNIEQSLADLKAQVAATQKGVEGLLKSVDKYTLAVVKAYIQHVQDNAEQAVRNMLGQFHSGQFRYEMDNGNIVQVNITIDKEKKQAIIDFTGTSKQSKDNFNAPLAITKSAVLYVLRTLVKEKIPLNEGCLKPITIIVPEGSFLNPKFPAAVVAGNVETSQYIVDTLLGALNVLAGSQGTCNNFTFGDDEYQYYETICGGSGAGKDFNGADAVQVHMTNTRLTDPEILETRFPVLLDSFSIKLNSGGKGQHHGGNGVVRKIRFKKRMQATIVSGHRRIPPFGLNSGEPGSLGKNAVIRSNNSQEQPLKGCDSTIMDPNDIFVIETPGGGGYGKQ